MNTNEAKVISELHEEIMDELHGEAAAVDISLRKGAANRERGAAILEGAARRSARHGIDYRGRVRGTVGLEQAAGDGSLNALRDGKRQVDQVLRDQSVRDRRGGCVDERGPLLHFFF